MRNLVLGLVALLALASAGCAHIDGEVLVAAQDGYWYERCPCNHERPWAHQTRGPIGQFCKVNVILGIKHYYDCKVRRLGPEDWTLNQVLPVVPYVTDEEALRIQHPDFSDEYIYQLFHPEDKREP